MRSHWVLLLIAAVAAIGGLTLIDGSARAQSVYRAPKAKTRVAGAGLDPVHWSSPLERRSPPVKGFVSSSRFTFWGDEGLNVVKCPTTPLEWKQWRDETKDFLLEKLTQLKKSQVERFMQSVDLCRTNQDLAKTSPATYACVDQFREFLNYSRMSTGINGEFFNTPENLERTTLPEEMTSNDNRMLRQLQRAETYREAIAEIRKANEKRPEKEKWNVYRYRIQNIDGFTEKFVAAIYVPGDSKKKKPDQWIRVSTETPPEFVAKNPGARLAGADNNICMFTSLEVPPAQTGGVSREVNIGDWDMRPDRPLTRRYLGEATPGHGSGHNCKDCHQSSGPLFTNPDPSYFEAEDGTPYGPEANREGFMARIEKANRVIANYDGPAKFGHDLYPPGKGPMIGDQFAPPTEELLKACSSGFADPKFSDVDRKFMQKALKGAMQCTQCHDDLIRSSIRESYRSPKNTWALVTRLTTGQKNYFGAEKELTQHTLMPPHSVVAAAGGGAVKLPVAASPGKPLSKEEEMEIAIRKALPVCLKTQYAAQYYQEPKAVEDVGENFDRRLKTEHLPLMHLVNNDCGVPPVKPAANPRPAGPVNQPVRSPTKSGTTSGSL